MTTPSKEAVEAARNEIAARDWRDSDSAPPDGLNHPPGHHVQLLLDSREAQIAELRVEFEKMAHRSTSDEIQPCPFCGTTDVKFERREATWKHNEGTFPTIVACCQECGATGRAFGHMSMNNEKVAKMYWNDRFGGVYRELADLTARNAALVAERDAFRAVTFQIVPGEHGQGEEIPTSPEHLKTCLNELQAEWDGAEVRAFDAQQQLAIALARVSALKAELEAKDNSMREAIGLLAQSAPPFDSACTVLRNHFPDQP